jgi:alginate O-acetyltransferase complex protein AlgI
MYFALMATMFLGGLWHGASYTFAVWGIFHGLILCLEKGLGPRNPLLRLPSILQAAITFHLVMAAWIFFRCQAFGQATDYFRSLASWSAWLPEKVGAGTLILLAACLLIVWGAPDLNRIRVRVNAAWVSVSFACLAFSVALMLGRQPAPFLYFQF